jgi:hypothetical protein
MTGYKTYCCAAALGLVAVLQALGVLDPEVANWLEALCAGGGLAALRAGVAKSAP